MAKDYTKASKLSNVTDKETYCELLEKAIEAKEKRLEEELEEEKASQDSYEIAMLNLEIFNYKKSLKLNKIIAEDFRKDYEVVFLPEYERRLEDCFANFDETYKIMLENIDRIPNTSPAFRLVVEGYAQENPDNADEDKMLLFYETIKGFVGVLKKEKLGQNQSKNGKLRKI